MATTTRRTTITGAVAAVGIVAAVSVAATASAATTTASTTATTTATWSGVVSSPTDDAIRLAPVGETTAAADRTVVVDPTQRFQTWRGVGAALTDSSVELLAAAPEAAALLYGNDPNGAGLDLLRLPLSATDFSTEWWTWDWNSRRGIATPPAPALAAMDTAAELAGLNPSLSIVAVPWTAPAELKSPKRVDGGSLHRRSTRTYGDLLVAQVEHLVAAGLPVDALSIQNEPGHSGNYPTMTMTDKQLVDVGAAIAPAVHAVGVELWAVDHNWADRDRVDRVVADAPDVWGAAAYHCYAGSPDQMAGSPVPAIVTECTGTTDTWAGTFAWDARHLVADSIAAGATGLMMWNLALDPDHGPKAPGGCEECRGLLTIDPTTGSVEPTPEFFTLAHVSRAAPGGSVHIGSSTSADVPVAAFERPDGTIGVVGHNTTGADAVIEFVIGGASHRVAVPTGALFTVGGDAPTAEPLPLAAGDLAVDDAGGRWFIAADGTALTRQRIPSDQTFACDHARGGEVVDVTAAALAALPTGPDRVDAECIIRAPEGDAHVVTIGGVRQWIPDAATWFCEIDRGLEVIDTTRSYVDAMPEGAWRTCG